MGNLARTDSLRLILNRPEWKSIRDLLVSVGETEIEAFLDTLSPNALRSLPFLFEHWAHPEHQLAPGGDWNTWVILGGRGAGKTRAGAEWVRTQVEGSGPYEPGRCRKVALLGSTYDQARDVMIFGESGILANSPPDRRPDWIATRRQLLWPNGAVAQCFSAADPEALRGPQFDCAWVDELAKWKQPERAWDMLQFALRLGDNPQQVVTTTPRNVGLLHDLLEADGTVQTSAPKDVNEGFLANGFLERVRARFGGTRMARQELDGELLFNFEGGMWTPLMLDTGRKPAPEDLDRIVVAVDPPVTSGKSADECGIVVAGVRNSGAPQTWEAYVLADGSLSGATPNEWAARALALFHDFKADRIVAEVNQGGDLVETILRQLDPMVPYRAVRASRGKLARAEPVAALYEQGRVHHGDQFGKLEDQMCQMTLQGFQGSGSPDRVDALVWALTDLMVEPAARYQQPRVRHL